MFVLISALKSEIEPFVQKLRILSKEKMANGTLYVAQDVHLLRLGLGRERAVQSLRAYLQKYHPDFLFTIGFAGHLAPEPMESCTLFAVEKIFSTRSKTNLAVPVHPDFRFLPRASLLTSDEPVLKTEEKKKLFSRFGTMLVDMEAYDLAVTCQHYGKSFYVLKSVTDSADETTAQNFKAHYRNCAQKMFSIIQPVLFP